MNTVSLLLTPEVPGNPARALLSLLPWIQSVCYQNFVLSSSFFKDLIVLTRMICFVDQNLQDLLFSLMSQTPPELLSHWPGCHQKKRVDLWSLVTSLRCRRLTR